MTKVELVDQALRRISVVAALALALVFIGTPMDGMAPGVTPAIAQQAGQVPGNALGGSSDAEFWRAIREGQSFSVSIPDKKAATLVQSEGDNWRAWRNGPVSIIGAWIVLGFIALCALFFAIRGRVRIDAGPSGMTIERFNGLERFTHWLTAGSFVVLALTGLNLLYGRYVLLPVIGPDAFSALSTAGKYAHNFLAFPFMLGLVVMLFLWAAHNIPNRYDLIWLARGGGLFTKGSHPPSKKFNAGQKIIFWVTILGGLTLSISGITLMFPFEFAPWSALFGALNAIGFSLPTDLSPIQEMQLSQLGHAATSMILIGIMIAHIYIGSVGMEGAFAAMGTGMVDENWAREHHDLWVAEAKGEPMMVGGHGDD